MGRVLDFMRVLWSLDHALQSASKRMEAKLGITGPQRLVVRLLGKRPGISAGELAALLQVHPSTLTGVLQRLTARGLVERKQDPEDSRRAILSLSEKGRVLDSRRSGTVEQGVRQALQRISPRSLHEAQTVLGVVDSELRSEVEE
jgi:DNA-binding MarR family transcriptional regulator